MARQRVIGQNGYDSAPIRSRRPSSGRSDKGGPHNAPIRSPCVDASTMAGWPEMLSTIHNRCSPSTGW
jgi:hypothetical protein